MERRAYFRQLLSLCDLFTLVVSFVATCLLYGRVTHNQFWALTNYAWVLWVIGPVWVLSLRSLGLYQPESYESILSIVSRLVRAQVIAGLMLLSTMYLTKSSEVSRLLLQTFLGLSFVVLMAQKAAVRIALQRWRREGAFKRKTLVMCDISQISAYAEMVDANSFWRTEIVGFVIPFEQIARNGANHS